MELVPFSSSSSLHQLPAPIDEACPELPVLTLVSITQKDLTRLKWEARYWKAQHHLAMAVKQLPQDWQEQYNITPVLMESFVEILRFTSTCYKATNWVNVGQTKGRGKLGPSGIQSVPIKDIFLYPLAKNFRKILST
jgi:hypothetical protein